MERRTLGRTGLQVSVLGFGGAEIGYEGATQDDVTRLLNEALDDGLNVIDTAECYLNSEELIGNAVSHRRADYFLFTKCGHEEMGRGDWSRASLLRTMDRSLQRLKTNHVDLVQLHSCSLEELQKGEVIEALKEMRANGQTRFIGYSGDGEAAKFAVECGEFDTLQTSLSILDQEAIDLTLPIAARNNIGVIVKRPVGNVAWRYGNSEPEEKYHLSYWERALALDYDLFRLPQAEAVAIALRFTLMQPGVSTAIVGTKKPGRWRQNAAALTAGPLPAEQAAAIRDRFKAVSNELWVGQT